VNRFLTRSRFAFALAFVVSAAVHADQAILPLGKLIGSPDVIALGIIDGTNDGQLPGDFLLAVAVEETLKGPALQRFTLQGNDRNSDSFPRLSKGTRILAFLQGSASAGFHPLAGEHGVIHLGDPSADVARELILRGVKLGGGLGLTDFDDLLEKGTPAPPSLLGSLTEELSLRVTKKDQALLAEMACDSQQAFLPAVQLWAISRVGPLEVADAAPCLEDFLVDKTDEARAIAASEALGELRDPGSVPALVELIESLPQDKRIFGLDKKGDSNPVAGKEDPEDQKDPRPDPDESSDPGEIELLPTPGPAPDGDGEREPDSAPSKDRPSRGAGGGLAEASILALGKIGDPSAVPLLVRIGRQGEDLSLHSTAVNALGLIGGNTVMGPLRALSRTHPNPLVRQQAKETLERLRKSQGGSR